MIVDAVISTSGASGMMSRSAISAISRLIVVSPLSEEYADTRISAPSSSRMDASNRLAMSSSTSRSITVWSI